MVKWIAEEPQSDLAYLYQTEVVVAPDLLRAELTQALYKKVRKKELTVLDALAGRAEAEELITFIPATHLSSRALELSLELDHAAGDCFFLAIAESLAQPMITADLRFVEVCRGTRYEHLVQALAAPQ